MSRIQHILEKAERDGSVRRLADLETSPAGVGPHDELSAPYAAAAAASFPAAPLASPFAPVPESPFSPAPSANVHGVEAMDEEILESAASAVPSRTVVNARLDRRLLSAANAESATAEQYRALRTRVLQA